MNNSPLIEQHNLRLDRLGQDVVKLEARHQILLDESSSLTISAQNATSRLAYRPDVNDLMGEFQSRTHQKTIGKMETILSGLLQDVFGMGDSVVIEVDTKRQQANLTISVTNGDKLEDAFLGRGGSIANVLSLGLRFIALSRARLRKFVVLDEADCWVRPEHVPAFIGVISALSREMGIQVLMISHHEHSLFGDQLPLIHIKRVFKKKIVPGSSDPVMIKTIVVEKTSGPEYQWQDNQEGIRSFRFCNLLTCDDVTIPLSPTITCLIGDNDIGKSGLIVAGIRSLLRNEGKDAWIRHYEESATVEMNMGPEGAISWTRALKGARKTSYSYMFDGQEIHHSDDSDTPEWIGDLGFDLSDMDIQISTQKKPVFLLDKPGTQQAAMLSVGKEAGYLLTMQSLYRGDIKLQSEVKRDCERRLNQISKELKILEPIVTIAREVTQLQRNARKISDEITALNAAESLIQAVELDIALGKKTVLTEIDAPTHLDTVELGNLINRLELLDAAKTLSGVKVIDDIELIDTFAIQTLCASLEKYDRIKGVAVMTELPEPQWLDTKQLRAVGRRLTIAAKLKNTQALSLVNDTPSLPIDDLGRLIIEMESAACEIKRLKQNKNELTTRIGTLADEREAILDSTGGECPACGSTLGDYHAHH